MTGGIIQLVAVGALDLYLTGNPQITWFKSIYRRHTEFGFCDMNIKIPDIQFGTTHYINIPRDADLLNKLTLVVDLPSPTMYIKKHNNNNRNMNKTQIIDELDDYIIITPEKTKEIITTKKILLTTNDYVKIKFNNYEKFNKDEIKSDFCLVVKADSVNKIFANNYENVYIAYSMPIYDPYKTFANIFNYTYTSANTAKIYDASQIYEIIRDNIYNVIYTTDDMDIMNEVKFYNNYSLINHKITNKQYNPKIRDYFSSLIPYNNTISYNAMIEYINIKYDANILSVNINTIANDILEHIVNSVKAIKAITDKEQSICYENMIQKNKKFKFLFNDNINNKYDFAENIVRQYMTNINNIELSMYSTDDIKIILNGLGIENVNYDKKYFTDYISSSIFNKLYTVSDILYNCNCPYYLKNNDIGNYNCVNVKLYLEHIRNEYMQNEYSYNSIIKKYNMKINMKYQLQEYKKYTDKILNILVNSTIYTELRNGVDMNIRKLSQYDFIDTNDNFINAIQNTVNTENMYIFTNIDTRKYMPQHLQDICYKYNDFKTYNDIENLVMFDKICLDMNLNIDIHKTKDEIELYNLIVNTTRQKQVLSNDHPKHAWVKNLGYKMIDEISLIINGKQIDTQSGELMLLQHKLFDTYEHKRGIDIMMGNIPDLYTLSEYIPPAQLYIKFNLFFCKDYGNSLPLVNMTYSSIQLKISLASIDKLLYVSDTGYIYMQPKINCSLLGTYIYVSSKERLKLSNKYHTLIECYSCSNTIVNANNLNLRFELNHPCKYLLWKLELLDTNILQIADKIMIEFNSQIREDWQEAKYYQLVQSYNRNINPLDINEGIYIMCLRPEQLQPSGSTNLSCIKNINFNIKINNNITSKIKFTLWTCSYNIFVVSSGLSGLLFI